MDHDTTRLAFPRPAKTANYSDGLLDGGDLVRRIYSARGHALEAVLEEAFNKANAPLVKLDTGGAPGRPDYLIQLENFPSIVAEVKSREADDQYIIFNATT